MNQDRGMPDETSAAAGFIAKFLTAQNQVYPHVLQELRAGQKRSHWMWFIFPQIAGLGLSAQSRHYAIDDLDQARAYLAHPVLAARLRECTRAVLLHAPDSVAPRSLAQILGSPDDLKFHSSMTLFGRAAPDEACFASALSGFFAGVEDPATIALLKRT